MEEREVFRYNNIDFIIERPNSLELNDSIRIGFRYKKCSVWC